MKIEGSWRHLLEKEFKKTYMKNLLFFLDEERKKGKDIYPEKESIFAAFNLTPFDQVRVVILGQDPYHGKGEAHGLCFSSLEHVPPSLKNIFKELSDDLNISRPSKSDLSSWARSGVLLLNAVLTVEKDKPQSHQNKGWEIFTHEVIQLLSEKKDHLVFILWGLSAQKKSKVIDQNKHLILTAPHPSPLSVYRGFFGSKPFSKTNEYLEQHGIEKINWELN